jgi:hypothetical protein
MADEGPGVASPDGSASCWPVAAIQRRRLKPARYRDLVLRRATRVPRLTTRRCATPVVLSRSARRHDVYEACHLHLRRPGDQQLGAALPAGGRRRYDRVVEQVAQSYRAGKGNCG